MSTPEKVINVDVVEVEERKLKFNEKLPAVINGGTGTFHSQMIQLFLLFFYTDIMKISPAYVAGLFLVTRIVDAFLAPAFGILVDRVTTPWGKYKPWVIAIGLGMGLFGWLAFTNFDLGENGNIVYATITYAIYSIFMAIGQGPGGALGPAMTKRIDDRISMGQMSYFVIMIGAILAQVAVQPLYKALGGGNDARGFSLIMGLFAGLSIFIAIYQQFKIKERYVIQPAKNEKGPSLKEMFVAVFTNKTAIIVYLFVLGINLMNGIRSGASIYYFKYYFHNEGLLAISGMVMLLPTMIGVAFSSKVTKWIGIKKNLVIGAIVGIVGSAAIIALPPSSNGIILFMVLSVIISFFAGLSTPAQATMMPAAMDYTEWKTKLNVNAFMGSFQGFLQTLATALAGAITAGALAVFGYTAGVEQSSETLFGLKVLMSIIPAVVSILTLSVIWFDLTEDKQAQIAKELEERRKNTEGK
ncbi:MFS transporter [Neobacillus vireti]|uniref:MFS transporter n=1 Tax=Neobacillus vireti TaxID=220686 RepID=UPI002FFE1FAF